MASLSDCLKRVGFDKTDSQMLIERVKAEKKTWRQRNPLSDMRDDELTEKMERKVASAYHDEIYNEMYSKEIVDDEPVGIVPQIVKALASLPRDTKDVVSSKEGVGEEQTKPGKGSKVFTLKPSYEGNEKDRAKENTGENIIPSKLEFGRESKKFLNSMGSLLSWEKDQVSYNPGGTGVAGDTTAIFWKPGTDYGIYVSLGGDLSGKAGEESVIPGGDLLYRVTTKKNKYQGLGNQFAATRDLTTEKLANLAKQAVERFEQKFNAKQEASAKKSEPSDIDQKIKALQEKYDKVKKYDPANEERKKSLQAIQKRIDALNAEKAGVVEPTKGDDSQDDTSVLQTPKYQVKEVPGGMEVKSKKPVVSQNTIFTEDLYAKAKKEMQDLLGQMNMGADPRLLIHGATIAGYHIEKGARTFAAYSKAMVEDLGEKIKPYLKMLYNAVRDHPDAEAMAKEMDPYDVVTKTSLDDALKSDIIKGEEKHDDTRDGGTGPGALEGKLPADVQPHEKERRPGEGIGSGGKADKEGNGRPDEGGPERVGGVGGGKGALHSDRPGEGVQSVDNPEPVTEPRPMNRTGENPGNYHITEADIIGKGTRGNRIDNNLAAIRLIKTLDKENRFPTVEEQSVLARYVGWGGLKNVFDPRSDKPQDKKAFEELKSLLTPDELFEARQSMQTAFYTDRKVIDSMFNILEHLGIKGGHFLEPTYGTGLFPGLMPEEMSESSKWYGAEMDPITAKIGQYLHPRAQFVNEPFQKAEFPYDKFDVAIGNPPFGDWRITDTNKKRAELNGMKIHNYVLGKSGMHVKPGGVMSFVITSRFMDTADPEARDYLAKHFKFLAAIRLPNTAFKENAGTDVVTDIVLFQKLLPGEKPDLTAAWLDTKGSMQNERGEDVSLNKYFVENPEQMIGVPSMKGTMYPGGEERPEFTLEPRKGEEIGPAINALLQGEHMQGLKDVANQNAKALAEALASSVEMNREDVGIGGFFREGDTIGTRLDDDVHGNPVYAKLEPSSPWEWKHEPLTKILDILQKPNITPADAKVINDEVIRFANNKPNMAGELSSAKKSKFAQYLIDLSKRIQPIAKEGRSLLDKNAVINEIQKARERYVLGADGYGRIKGMMELRDKAYELVRAEKFDLPEMESLRKELNKLYDKYVGKYGFINDPANASLMSEDIKIEAGLEGRYQMAISESRANTLGVKPSPSKAEKASLLVERVNFPNKEILHADSTQDGYGISLSEKGKLDLSYIAGLTNKTEDSVSKELSDKGLIYKDPVSGKWVQEDEYLSGNVKQKLREAEETPGHEKNVEALKKVLPKDVTADEVFVDLGATWVPKETYEDFARALGIENPKAMVLQETGRVSISNEGSVTENPLSIALKNEDYTLPELINAVANHKALVAYDGYGKDREINKERTKALIPIGKAISQIFKDWIFADPARAETLTKVYNDTQNTHAPRTVEGSHLKTVGANPAVSLYDTQKRAAWRMIQQPVVLLDHVVGSGKAQPMDAGILTPGGWTTMGEIKVGDMAVSANGTPTRVEAVFPQGMKEIFRVEFNDGSSTECCEEHLWMTQTYRERGFAQRSFKMGKDWKCGKNTVKSLSDIKKTLRASHLGAKNHSIPLVSPINFTERIVSIEPYLMGCLLGDGSFRGKELKISSADQDILDSIKRSLPKMCSLVYMAGVDYGIRYTGKTHGPQGSHPLIAALRSYGAWHHYSYEKFIPEDYIFNSVDIRVAILQGLLDTDGWVNKTGHSIYYNTTSLLLGEGVTEIVQSLGGIVRKTSKTPSYTYNGEKRKGRMSYQYCISLPNNIKPFRLKRKMDIVKPKTSYLPTRYIVDVVPVGKKQAQCIRIADPSHLYVTDDFIVTHNTMTIITGVQERKRMGLSQKPLIAVPNHIIGQWAKSYANLYPGANVLAASEKDFSAPNRKRLLARMATGKYDAIIIGHSSLSFIPLERETQAKFVREEMAHLEKALFEAEVAGDRSTIRNLTNRIEKKREKIKHLMDMPKNDVATWESMGIDHITVDESQEFKNLEYSTFMQSMAGMGNAAGSLKAFDLYAKIRHTRENNGGVAFATGTPISNSLVEMYSLLRYLNKEEMEKRGLGAFDSWAKSYAGIENRIEYTATQKLKDRLILASFNNIPELKQLYNEFADVVSRDDLKKIYKNQMEEYNKTHPNDQKITDFPEPKIKGGQRQLDLADSLPHQKEYMDYLVARAEILEKNKDPEYRKIDNHLWLMHDARKMALDIRLVDPKADPGANTKVDRTAENVKRLYDQWHADKGTQLVFCDLSTPLAQAEKEANKFITQALKVAGLSKDAMTKRRIERMTNSEKWDYIRHQIETQIDRLSTSDVESDMKKREDLENWYHSISDEDAASLTTVDTKFSVYDELKSKLIGMGIPAGEIKFIHEANTRDRKEELFSLVNSGQVRVLIGSSKKMGAGTNVQERLVGLHHMDAPWRPSDVEQREGRIIRQGNALYERDPKGFEAEILSYSTRNTFDAVMWQILARKAEMIESLKSDTRSVEDQSSDSASYADFMAESTGSPAFKEKHKLEGEIGELESTERRIAARRASAEGTVKHAKDTIEKAENTIQDREESVKTYQAGKEYFHDGKKYKNDIVEAQAEARKEWKAESEQYDEELKAYEEWEARKKTYEEEMNADSRQRVATGEKGTSVNEGNKLMAAWEAEHPGPKKPKTPIGPDALSRLRKFSDAAKMATKIRDYISEAPVDSEVSFNFGDVKTTITKEKSWNEGMFRYTLFLDGIDSESSDGKELPASMINNILIEGRAEATMQGRVSRAKEDLARTKKNIETAKLTLDQVQFKDAGKLASKKARYAEVVKEVSALEDKMALEREDKENRYIKEDTTRFGSNYYSDAAERKEQRRLSDLNKPAMSKKEGAGGTVTPEHAQAELGKLKLTYPGAAKFEVVQSEKDLPENVIKEIASRGDQGNIEGVFDPVSKRLFIVSDKLTSPERVQTVVKHELEHKGIRTFLGDRIKTTFDEIYRDHREEVNAIREEYGLKPGQTHIAVDEFLARYGEKYEKEGAIQRVYSQLRRALRQMGFTITWTNNDLISLAGSALKAEGSYSWVTVDGKSSTQRGKSDVSAPESTSNSRRVNIQKISDAVNGKSFSNKGFDGLDVPTQRSVLASMLTALHDPEIRDRVVRSIPVEMVDNFMREQGSADVSLHDKSMLHNAPTVDLKNAISTANDTSSLMRAIARIRTEKETALVDSNLISSSVDDLSAMGTSDINHDENMPESKTKVNNETVPLFSRISDITDKLDDARKKVSEKIGTRDALEGLKQAFIPTMRSPAHLAAANELAPHLGEHNRKIEQINAKMKDFLPIFRENKGNEIQGLTPNESFMERVDKGLSQPTPELQKAADYLKKTFDALRDQIEDVNPEMVEKWRESYMPRIVAREDVERAVSTLMSKRPLETKKSFAKQRVFEDIAALKEAGFKLISDNPMEMVIPKAEEMLRYVAIEKYLADLKAKGELQNIGLGARAMPAGYAEIPDRFGTIWYKDRSGQLVKSGRRVVPEAHADILTNYLSKSAYTLPYVGGLFKTHMTMAGVLNQAQLGTLSAFHAGFTSAEVTISHGANVLRDFVDMMHGKATPGELFRSVIETPFSAFLMPSKGKKIMEEWISPGAQPQFAKVAQAIELAMGRAHSNQDLMPRNYEKMLWENANGMKLKALARSPLAFVDWSSRFIMDTLVPRQKFAVMGELVDRIIRDNPGKSMESLAPEFRQAWNRVDARLGQVNYERLFMNNVSKNVLQALLRAPGWTGGTIAEIGGAGKDTMSFIAQWKKTGKMPEVSDRVLYTISLVMTTAVINGMLTKLLTGDDPDGMDFWAFRTGGKDEKGHDERFVLPTYAKDLFAYYENTGHTLLAKMHPSISMAGEMYRNKDYYGNQIYNPEDFFAYKAADLAKYGIKQFEPFWARGMAKEAQRGGGFGETLMNEPLKIVGPEVGVMPASSVYTYSKAEKEINKIMQEKQNVGGRSPEKAEQHGLKLKLRRDLITKNDTQSISDAVKEGKITVKTAREIMKSRNETPLQYSFTHLTIEEAMRVFDLATPEERKQVSGKMSMKLRRSFKDRTPEDRKALLERYKSLTSGLTNSEE